MSVGFTFGSLGDILQLCQIARDIGKALNDSRGSAQSYQKLRDQIDQFVHILENVITVYQEREHTAWLSGIDALIRKITQQCMKDLEETLRYFQSRYGSSFGENKQGSQLNPKMIGKKVQFEFKERERLKDLRDKLSWCTQSLSPLLSIHNLRAARLDSSSMHQRILEVRLHVERLAGDVSRLSDQLFEQHASITLLTARVDATNVNIVSGANRNDDLVETVRRNTSSVQELRSRLDTKLDLMLEKLEKETYHRFFRGPESTTEKPLLFEDALGVVMILPIEWLRSWDHLRDLISNSFENKRGHQKVLRGEYTLEDDADTGQLELMSLPWEFVMKQGSGRKINMVMKFAKAEKRDTYATESFLCPGCGLARDSKANKNLKCDCGMWMRLRRLETGRPSEIAFDGLPTTEDDEPGQFHRVLFDFMVPPVRGRPTHVTVWTCCQCLDSGMTTKIVGCPTCGNRRCVNCLVQSIQVRY